RVDDDDVVAVVDMRGVRGFVLAAQAHRHDRSEPADDEPGGINRHPFLFDLGGLCRKSLHGQSLGIKANRAPKSRFSSRAARCGQRCVENITSYISITYKNGIYI